MILNIPDSAWQQLDINSGNKITFSQCKDDFGNFKFDNKNTEVKPNPVHRGDHLKFKIVGYLDDPIDIDDVWVKV